MKTNRSDNKGFTLIELIVVVAIIAILAAIAVSAYSTYINKAKITLSLSALSNLRKALEIYSTEHQKYPTAIDFTNFTDQNGVAITDPVTIEAIKGRVFSFDSYVYADPSYTLVAKGADTNHTVITVTPQNTTY